MLVTIGNKAQAIAKKALLDGTTAQVHSFQKIDGVLDIVKPQIDQDTLLLIKGPMSNQEMIIFAQQLQLTTNKRRTR